MAIDKRRSDFEGSVLTHRNEFPFLAMRESLLRLESPRGDGADGGGGVRELACDDAETPPSKPVHPPIMSGRLSAANDDNPIEDHEQGL